MSLVTVQPLLITYQQATLIEFHGKVSLMWDCFINNLLTVLEKSPESGGIHKQIRCNSLKNYSIYFYEESVGRSNFPDYHNFENINAYSSFIQKVMGFTDLILPVKSR